MDFVSTRNATVVFVDLYEDFMVKAKLLVCVTSVIDLIFRSTKHDTMQ